MFLRSTATVFMSCWCGVRSCFAATPTPGRLHDLAVEQVRASYQSRAVDVIEPMLTEKESDILRRGRNAGGISVPKSAKPSEYRRATALEALFGYLSLSGQQERIEELFTAICEALPV